MKSLLILMIVAMVPAIFAQPNRDPKSAKLVTSDIDLFWKAYEKAKPENDLIVYRDEYLKKGSPGLQAFTKLRIGNSCNLVSAINGAPQYFRRLREPSLKIKSYEPRIRASFKKMQDLYPDSVFPDVYFVIGRMTSGGTLTDNALYIGVDMYGRNGDAPTDELNNWLKAVVAPMDRIPYIVAHELIHYQQKFSRSGDTTLLTRAIGEGSADFIAELISGSHINTHLHEYGNPIEKELWLEFQREMNGKDVSNWMYQGDAAKTRPADLGYFMGYKIAETYYKNAPDKKQAVRDILEIKDVDDFFKQSRYIEKFTQ